MYALFLSIVCFILLFGFIFIFARLMKQNQALEAKELSLTELQSKIDSLQERLKERNKRKSFRIELYGNHCKIKFINFGNSSFAHLANKEGDAKILDISYKGMKIECDYDFSIKCNIEVEVKIMLMNESVVMPARIIRKEGHYIDKRMVYGLQFIKMSEQKKQQIFRLINSLELQRRKKEIRAT